MSIVHLSLLSGTEKVKRLNPEGTDGLVFGDFMIDRPDLDAIVEVGQAARFMAAN